MRALAVLLAALVFAGAAAADTNYTDGTGENPAAVDISGVVASNDPASGTFTLKIQVANMPTFADDAIFGVAFDTDRNASTGDQNGFDYQFLSGSNGWAFQKWDGTQFTSVTGLGIVVGFANGLLTATFHATDLGSPKALDFLVVTLKGADPQTAVTDAAPDTGLYTYVMTVPAATPQVVGTAVDVKAPPKAGARFVVGALSVKLSDGTAVSATGEKCTATLGGAKLAGHGAGGCTFALPKKAHGKRLSVKVTGKYAGLALGRTLAYKVK